MSADRAPAYLVTGASSGLGRAIVATGVARGFRMLAGVRRNADADALTRAFGHRVIPLCFDVTDGDAVAAAVRAAEDALGGATLAGLVNNAGIARPRPLLWLDDAALREVVEVNLIGAHRVTVAFAALLGAGGPRAVASAGRIVVISSTAGQMPTPLNGAYAAAKHALEGWAVALRRELIPYGIDVIIVAPGPIATPIWDKTGDADPEAFIATPYATAARRMAAYARMLREHAMPPERVAETVWRGLLTRHPRTRYAVVERPWRDWTLPRLLPARSLDRAIARRIGLGHPGE
jgi:hypothetical protein